MYKTCTRISTHWYTSQHIICNFYIYETLHASHGTVCICVCVCQCLCLCLPVSVSVPIGTKILNMHSWMHACIQRNSVSVLSIFVHACMHAITYACWKGSYTQTQTQTHTHKETQTEGGPDHEKSLWHTYMHMEATTDITTQIDIKTPTHAKGCAHLSPLRNVNSW